ncbi:hypothetical protein [Streptomyces noursei]|uniref:hypothetical protein n=1 Tax=Streptomyces noursei TaxID=1971 RepID=UPI0023B79A7C|nr:hypothetical protein [Streptomyces noursei]
MTRNVLNRPGRHRLEMTRLVLDEYGPYEDWPPGVGYTCELLCTAEEQLPRTSYQKVLAAFYRPVWPAAALKEMNEQIAFAALAEAAKLLGGFSFGILLNMAEELDEARPPVHRQ